MRKIIITILSILTLLSYSSSVYAAELKLLNNSKEDVRVNDVLSLDLYINTQNESINTIASTIFYNKDVLHIKKIYTGNSIINIWIDNPDISKDGEISFSGITPGGYNGDKGNIITILFDVKKSGKSDVKIIKSQLFRNDGKGTEIKAKITNLNLNILDKINKDNTNNKNILIDKDLPEPFNPEINRDINIFDNKYFIVFNTQDKISGIHHYEVCEGDEYACIVTTSPYLLKDQELKTKIYVKAVDKSYNMRIAIVNPQNILWYEHYVILAIILLICTFGIFIKKRNRSIYTR